MRLFSQIFSRPFGPTLVVALTLAGASLAGEQVVCHYDYGGESKALVAQPVASPYAVTGIAVGSYFRLRVVFQEQPADIASIKVYTYAERNDDSVLIHQATFAYPPPSRNDAPHGFSGLQTVYEPMRGSELQYWCLLAPVAGKAAP